MFLKTCIPKSKQMKTLFQKVLFRRRKAAFKKFYERELGELKEDKPGLKLSQYKDIIFKRWLKSPENPMNTDK